MSLPDNTVFVEMRALLNKETGQRIEAFAQELYGQWQAGPHGGTDALTEKHQQTFCLLVDVMNLMLLDYMNIDPLCSWYSAYVTAFQGLEENIDLRLALTVDDFRETMERNNRAPSN